MTGSPHETTHPQATPPARCAADEPETTGPLRADWPGLLASLGWGLRCGLAIAAVAAGWGLRVALEAWVGPGLPTYVTFYPAVMAVALLAGFGPGLLATALAGFTAAWFILPPEGLAVASPVDRLGLAIFAAMGLFMSVVAELYRRNRDKAAAYDRELALRETNREKEFLANLLEHAAQPFAVGYPDGRLGRLNRAFEQLTGYAAAELRAIDWSTTLTPPEWRDLERQKLDELNRSGRPVRYEKEYIRKDGSRVPIELFVHLVRGAQGQPEYYYSFIADITERKAAEATVARMSRILSESQQIAHLGSFEYVAATRTTVWSEEEYHIYGLDPASPSPPYDVLLARCIHPDDAVLLHETFTAAMQSGSIYELEHRILRPDGSVRWVYDRAHPYFDEQGNLLRYVGATLDITERKAAEMALRESEQRIRASLAEKEVLLKEIHHRVKNNMQVISSLVALQAERLPDDSMRAAFQDVTHRVRSMALVHEKLYQSADMARVEFAEYARSLLNYLWRAHDSAASGVRLTLDLEPAPLSVNAAVPSGLILNELVSNALKHAFHGRSGGEVAVSLRGAADGQVCLGVRDNGVGLPPDLDWRHADSLGLRLVQMLAGQLHATVEIATCEGEGTGFQVVFARGNQ